jgi:hypothetical protein
MVELLVAGGLGILGTLVGVIGGGYITQKSQARELSHLDATRFQDVRLEFYARYTRAINVALAARTFGKRDSKAYTEFVLCFETIRLIASPPVRDAANAVHVIFGNAHVGETEESISKELIEEFHVALGKFIEASRMELHIPESRYLGSVQKLVE